MRKRNLLAGTVVIGLVAAGSALGGAAMANAGDPLVYVCPDTQGHSSVCANGQEFEVFDKNGAPIVSVGETGGLGVFGDNSSVYGPSSVFTPSVVTSYTTPAIYAQTFGIPNTCTAPERWDEPHGIWGCFSGKWVKKVSF